MDLDEVLVHVRPSSLGEGVEVVLLHNDVAEFLQAIDIPVVLLTHRSRAEADFLLRHAGIDRDLFAMRLAAEDLMGAAIRSFRLWSLLSLGLRKSLALRVMTSWGGSASQIAFVDDRFENVEDMRRSQIGLPLLAPFEVGRDGAILTFDLKELLDVIGAWVGGSCRPHATHALRLAGVQRDSQSLFIGSAPSLDGSQHWFNRSRRSVRQGRKVIRRLLGRVTGS